MPRTAIASSEYDADDKDPQATIKRLRVLLRRAAVFAPYSREPGKLCLGDEIKVELGDIDNR